MTNEPPRATITKTTTIHTYSELWHASSCVLEAGLRDQRGSSWQFLSSALLTAFAFEAYLNHAGSQVLASWASLERLPPLSKLDLLSEVLKFTLPRGRGERPLQTIVELLDFRNTMAHGRTEKVESTTKHDVNDKLDDYLGEVLLAHWQRLTKTDDFALRARKDVEEVLTLLHDARPQPKEPIFTFGLGIHSATVEEQPKQ